MNKDSGWDNGGWGVAITKENGILGGGCPLCATTMMVFAPLCGHRDKENVWGGHMGNKRKGWMMRER